MTQRDARQRWDALAVRVRERWSELTEDDVLGVRGNAERLVDVLQTRYGFARDEALKERAAWSRSLAGPAAAPPAAPVGPA